MKPVGYVELQADYVAKTAAYGIELIRRRREKDRADAIAEVTERSIFGITLKPRTREQAIGVLEDNWSWGFLSIRYCEREEQLEKLVSAARHRLPMLIDVDLAGHLKYAEDEMVKENK